MGRGAGSMPLRPRLVAVFALVAAGTAVAVAVASYALVSRSRLRAAHDAAAAQAHVLLRFAADTAPGPGVDPGQAVTALAGRLSARGGFDAVVAWQGRTAQTSAIGPDAVPAPVREAAGRGRVVTAETEAGGKGYVVAGGAVQPDGPALYLFFPQAATADDLRVLGTVLVAAAGGAVLVSGAVGALAARGVLGPIRRARDAARRIREGDLATRLPAGGRDELAQLAGSMNEMAASLEETVRSLRALESSHRRFVSDVSHELRTPVQALTSAADVLEARMRPGGEGAPAELDADGRRAAELLVAGARRLAALVEDLMEISRLDAGAARVQWERVDLGQAVAGALRARSWEDAVRLDVPADVVTFADLRRLDAIVGNLVGNALEHGAPPVTVEASAGDGVVVVRVADRGPGLPPEALPHVFDRFWKTDAARPRRSGSGLGLAIARENARLHGGDVTAANLPDGGAVFTVTLPIREAPPPGL